MNTSNTIVAEIHSSYSQAETQLVTEAKKILDKNENRDEEKIKKLSDLGFKSSKPVRGIPKEELDKAQEIIFLTEKYNVIAPQYRFITDEKIDEINTKYGLVLAPAVAFIEDIPERNQDDIINFDFAERSRYEQGYNPYGHIMWKTADNRIYKVRNMSDSHLSNSYSWLIRNVFGGIDHSTQRARNRTFDQIFSGNWDDKYRSLEDDHHRYNRQTTGSMRASKYEMRALVAMYLELRVRGTEDSDLTHPSNFINLNVDDLNNAIKKQMWVACDKNSVDDNRLKLIKGNRFVPESIENSIGSQHKKNQARLLEIYDPIVLNKVRGGWLIVTAWGLEAQDENVVNMNRN